MISEAVLDAGPVIHIEQIGKLELLDILDNIYLSGEVVDEIGQNGVEKFEFQEIELEPESKDRAKYISNRYNLEMGESTSIAVALQEDIELVFTDDLDARNRAIQMDLEPHGTLAIVTRSYSMNRIEADLAKKIIEELRQESSLFLTSDLVRWAKTQIEKGK